MRALLLLALAAGLAGAKGPPDAATHVALGNEFAKVEGVEAGHRECPPSHRLRLRLEMPEPQWKLAVDEVTEPDAEGRIRVRITGKRPDGMLPQVMTATPVAVELPLLRKGHVYLVDVFYRAGKTAAYERIQAAVLRAS